MMQPRELLAKMQLSNLLVTSLGGFTLKIGTAGLIFLNGILLARLLGPREFGIYSIISATVALAATITALGLPTLITRQTAIYVAREQWGLLKGFISKSQQWVLLSSLVGGAMVVNLLFILIDEQHTIIHLGTLVVIFLLILIMALSFVRAAILRGLHWVISADFPELILRPFAMLIMLGACTLSIPKTDAAQALLMQLAAASLAFMAGLWIMRQRMPVEVSVVQPETAGPQWFVAALPFFGIALVGTLEGQVALYILGYRTDAAQVGLFQVASQLVGLMTMGLVAVNMPLQPLIATAWAKGDRDTVQKLATHAVRVSTAIALTGGIILITLTEPLLQLYGQSYQAAAPALRILVIGQLFNASAGSCGLILAMTGQQNMVLIGQLLALVVNVAAAWLLTNLWGSTGAAVAAALGLVTWNGLMAIAVLKRNHINTTILHSASLLRLFGRQ